MLDLTILREKNPAMAESIELWRKKYQRSYDFSKTSDQADFYEATVELGRHVAGNSTYASLELKVNNAGISGLDLNVTPKPVLPS